MKQLKRIIDYVGRDTENNPYIKIYYDFDNGIIKRSEQLDFRETNLASSFTRNSFPIFHNKLVQIRLDVESEYIGIT